MPGTININFYINSPDVYNKYFLVFFYIFSQLHAKYSCLLDETFSMRHSTARLFRTKISTAFI